MIRSLNEVLRKISWLIIPYLLILCICLVIKLVWSKDVIYFAVNGLNNSFGDYLAPYITDIGNGWTAIVLAAIFLLFNYRKALIIASAYAITSLFAQLIKFIFDAPRPRLYFKGQISKMHFVKGVEVLNQHSFPSGHTVTAFMMAVILTYFSINKAWGVLYLIIAILVGYSRMYLSEHFFEDVVAGSIIGVIITVFWLKWLDSQPFIHLTKWNNGLITK